MYASGKVIVIDSDGFESLVDVKIPDENEQAFRLAQESKNWNDYPFPQTINVDGIEIPQIERNLYKDSSSGKTYRFVLVN